MRDRLFKARLHETQSTAPRMRPRSQDKDCCGARHVARAERSKPGVRLRQRQRSVKQLELLYRLQTQRHGTQNHFHSTV